NGTLEFTFVVPLMQRLRAHQPLPRRCFPLCTSYDPATTEISTLSLHDALPIFRLRSLRLLRVSGIVMRLRMFLLLITFLKAHNEDRKSGSAGMPRPISYAVFCLKKKRPPRPRAARQASCGSSRACEQ